MKLYHVTFDINESETKIFRPRVPASAGVGEDKRIPRICLAPSIEKCIQAIPSDNRNLQKGSKIRIYEVHISEKDKHLIKPEVLFLEGLVPDALETQEHWYTKDLEMTSTVKEIVSFDYSFELAFSCIKVQQVIQAIKKLLIDQPMEKFLKIYEVLKKDFKKSEDIYGEIANHLNEMKEYDLYDNLWEELAMLPWAQTTRIYKVDFA